MRKFSGNLDEAHRTALRVAVKHGLKLPDFNDSRSLGDVSWRDLHQQRITCRHFLHDLNDKLGAEKRAADQEENLALDYVLHLAEIRSSEIDGRVAYGVREPGEPMGGGPSRGSDIHSGWRTPDGKLVRVLRPEDRIADFVCRDAHPDYGDGLTLGGLCRARAIGARTDSERRALSEGTDSAGGFLVPEILAAELIDRLRAKTRVIEAGARTIPMETDTLNIARLATGVTGSWKAENAAISEADPVFERVQFTARTLTTPIVRASLEVIEDSNNLAGTLTDEFAKSLAQELDRACLHGSGTAPEPRGLSGISGVNEVAHNGTLANYDSLVNLYVKLLQSNARTPTAALMNPVIFGEYAKLKDANNRYLERPELLRNLRFFETTQINANDGGSPIESSLWLGDFQEMLIAMRTTLRVRVLQERYMDSLQFGFIAWLRADMQVAHAASFGRLSQINY